MVGSPPSSPSSTPLLPQNGSGSQVEWSQHSPGTEEDAGPRWGIEVTLRQGHQRWAPEPLSKGVCTCWFSFLAEVTLLPRPSPPPLPSLSWQLEGPHLLPLWPKEHQSPTPSSLPERTHTGGDAPGPLGHLRTLRLLHSEKEPGPGWRQQTEAVG